MLQKYVSSERVIFLSADLHKQQALAEIMECASASESIVDAARFKNGILERENIISTGIGRGIAVPHTYSDAIKDLVLTVGISREGISDYGAMDDQPVHFVIMVAAGSHQHTEYLQILASISVLGKDEGIRSALLAATTADEVIAALSKI
jgi:mannitol/fructose-specific phosphotransferase system IIA component (Ntr-type)